MLTSIATPLLKWYQTHQRPLAWRLKKPNPWHILIVEIMGQQTQIATLTPYFNYFVKRWPTPLHMAQSNLDEILSAWSGLGYYQRARNLFNCAKMIVHDFDQHVPHSFEDLLTLPGIGPYSAGAIATIAFNQPNIAIDGNVSRVITRFLAIKKPLPKAQKEIESFMKQLLAETLSKHFKSGDLTQALMELGALICKPKNPNCPHCPLAHLCIGKENPHFFPVKPLKKQRIQQYTNALIAIKNNKIALIRRPEKGILASMWAFPDQGWKEKPTRFSYQTLTGYKIQHDQNLPKKLKPKIHHIFTHVELHVSVYFIDVRGYPYPGEWQWFSLPIESHYPIPRLTHKIINLLYMHIPHMIHK
ncbi:MAG: A/G-specific adenine glycosylase [Pseudomonadota bacterium]